MLNKVILIGRLTRDPETRYTQSGDPICGFTLAVDRNFTNAQGQREADFLPVSCYRKLAETCSRYLAKGRLVAVVGSIRTRNYQAQDGTKRYVTEINADEVRFLERAPGAAAGDGSSAPAPRVNAPAASEQGYYPDAPAPSAPSAGGFTAIESDDELPF